MTGALAGLYAGALFALCGWNKLFHPVRRSEMRQAMGRLFPDDPGMAEVISQTQLFGGIALLAGSLVSTPVTRVLVALSAIVLASICAVGFLATARFEMERQWRPEGTLDYVACVLWTSEVQLFALCVIALIGAVT